MRGDAFDEAQIALDEFSDFCGIVDPCVKRCATSLCFVPSIEGQRETPRHAARGSVAAGDFQIAKLHQRHLVAHIENNAQFRRGLAGLPERVAHLLKWDVGVRLGIYHDAANFAEPFAKCRARGETETERDGIKTAICSRSSRGCGGFKSGTLLSTTNPL